MPITVVDNGDGTATITGALVVDNHDGTATVSGPVIVIDQLDGTDLVAQDWPLLEYAICWAAGPSQSPVQPYWCNLSARTEGTTSVRRGKQYELDQVQPGEMTLTLRNDDGAFDPVNSASPFWPQVIPYRLIRLRAQYPATVNLLTATQATTLYSKTAGQTVTINGFSIAPGLTYTAQAVITAVGGTPSIAISWINVAGSVISTVTASGTGTLTVTGTAPAAAVGAYVQISMATGTSYTATDVQIEQNSTASAFATPGTWYSLFTGYVERWPQAWSSGGNYGTISIDCVDLFGFLANRPLLDPFAADLLALNPNFLYELNEQSGTTVFQDLTGNRGPAILEPTAVSNTLIAGQSLASGDNAPPGQARPSAPLTGAFLGGQGPILQSAQPVNGSGSPVGGGGALLLPANPATGLVGPAGSAWTRLIAARATASQLTSSSAAWYYYPAQAPIGSGLIIQVAPSTQIPQGGITDNSGGHIVTGNYPIPAIANATSGAMIDTDWHLYGISCNGSQLLLYCDDHAITAISGASAPTPTRAVLGAVDLIAGSVLNGIETDNWNGDLAFVCEVPAVLTAAQWLALNASWRNAWASGSNNGAVETSGSRYQRILGWAGYTGPTRIDTGSSVDYGPATDIQGGSNPTYALQALQNVVATEYGQHYIAADGTIVFQARTERYNPTPVATFGEHAGEIPYTGAKMDFDPTRVANQIEVDAQYGNAPYFASDSTSQGNYGQIGLQWTANSLDPNELQDGAEYLLYQNKQPLQRLEALPVDVGANPGLWGSLLPLDLGAAVTVNRRPSAAPAMSLVGFVEQVTWSIDDQRKVSWSGQVSNAANHYFATLDNATYGKLDSTFVLGF